MILPDSVKKIMTVFADNGFSCYAVGGSVRDTLMGMPTHGWDFTTDAIPEKIIALYPDSFYDNQFGTVGIKMYKSPKSEKNPEPELEDIYEITTYRSEKGYGDRRHPDQVTWGTSLTEDLKRRDFTVNAIAVNEKEIIDPFDGQGDIEKKIIKAVGDPDERFSEDALRMMRAIRIASQIGFQIEEKTFQAIKKNASLINEISKERVCAELIKILSSPYPADGILLLRNTTLLSHIIPELDRAFDVPQKSPKRHHIYDVGTHSVMALRHCPSTDPIVRFATLVHDVGKVPTFRKDPDGLITFFNHEVVGTRIVRDICNRLRFSKIDREKILTLVRWHQFSVDERQTDSAIRRIIRRVGVENMDDMLALRIGDRLGGGATETSWRLELFKKRIIEVQKQPFSVKDLKINGHDVMEILGCPPGPIIGTTLNAIFDLVDKGELVNERENLLQAIKDMKNNS